MAKGYQLIQAQTLTGSATSVTFSNIPQNYSDLILKISARTNYSAVNDYIYMSLNGNTSLNSYNMIYADGSSTVGYNGSGAGNATGMAVANGATSTANTFSNCEVYIPNYAGSTAKSASLDAVIENNATATVMELLSYLNTGTSAITTIALTPGNGPNFVVNSTFALYGVGGTRATGGTITSDFNFTYHTFTSTSTFTALEKIKGAEILMVAGGGGGAGSYVGAGGGGAGGVLYTAGNTLLAGTSYTALVGAGGTGATTSSYIGTQGANSTFSSLAAIGGGYGGSVGYGDATGTGGSGGSGGGAGSNNSTGSGGTPTSGQGYIGGNNLPGVGSLGSAAGGGGAGGAGSNANSGSYDDGASGGLGTFAYSQWLYATSTGVSGYIAGGGGGGSYRANGGSGGSGGGGHGGYATTNAGLTAGTANTGGGGGGAGSQGAGRVGAAGGSGLVIVRYPSV